MAQVTTVLMVNWSGSYGGTEKYQLNIVGGFDATRYRFFFASPAGEWPARLAEAGYRHYVVPMRAGLDLASIVRLRGIIRDEQVDIVHAQQSRGLVQAGLAAKLAGRAKVVQTEHNISLGWYKAGLFPWYVRRINNPIRRLVGRYIADRIVTLGQSGKTFYTDVLRLPPAKIAVIPVPHPVYPEHSSPTNPHPVIGTPAELTERKGLPYLIEAAPKVLQHYPDAQFLIIGHGHLQDELQRRIAELGVEYSVHLLGFVPNIAEQMKEWDMLVLPSLWDTFPQVVLEAMAQAVPVVASAVDGAMEMVLNEETGLLVPSGDPQALAQAILRLLSDRPLAQRMGRNGRRRVAQVYNLEGVVHKLDELYQDVLRVG